jgi:hypothetical protein
MYKRYFLWGIGSVGQRALKYLQPLNILEGIIDNAPAKQRQKVNGLLISGYDDVKPFLKDAIVIIAHFAFKEAEEILKRDNIRFMRLADFITNYYWETKKKHALGFIDFPVTTRCSLNCKDCMQYIPYRPQTDVPFSYLKKQLSSLFNHVSFVGEISIIGGEPFLHENLAELIGYIHENYSERIGSLVITTNGTIVPEKSVIEQCRKAGVFISVSDYSDTLKYSEQITELEAAVKNAGVKIERKQYAWSDPGKFNFDGTIIDCDLPHMQLFNEKLWRCTLMAAGFSAGLCKARGGHDFFDLSQEKNDELHNFLSGENFSQRTTQCQKCLYPQKIKIPSAVQMNDTA